MSSLDADFPATITTLKVKYLKFQCSWKFKSNASSLFMYKSKAKDIEIYNEFFLPGIRVFYIKNDVTVQLHVNILFALQNLQNWSKYYDNCQKDCIKAHVDLWAFSNKRGCP